MTVGPLAEQWHAGKVNLKPSTFALYESILSKHVLPRWRDVQLTQVEHGDIQAWVASLVGAGLSARGTICPDPPSAGGRPLGTRQRQGP